MTSSRGKSVRDVGLTVGRVVLGQDVEAATDHELDALVEQATLFARLAPAHKERVVHALQRKGHVVGFMGDGINDAPALRAADVGISVDNAVDIAKESADLILLEKNLLVLEDGVLEGRRVFGNIIKYIKMGTSSNFGNMFSRPRRERVPAVPAHAADPAADAEPPLRLLAAGHALRPGRRRVPCSAPRVENR